MPKGTRRTATPEKDIVTDTPSEENTVNEVTRAEFDALKESMDFLSSVVANLVQRVDNFSEKRAPTSDVATATDVVIKNRENLSEVEQIVKEVCGEEFESSVTVGQPGVSFILTITPPAHLRETPTDTRVKSISNIEGLLGVRAYAEKVRNHIDGWAKKNGKLYTR